jgi:hypothetical protein
MEKFLAKVQVNPDTPIFPGTISWNTTVRVYPKDGVPEHFIEGTMVWSKRPDSKGALPLLYVVNFMPKNASLLADV